MESNGSNIGWRTPDHDEVMARIDRRMTRSDYIEILGQVALAYKELTDAMAAVQGAKCAVVEYNPVRIFRWLFLRQPSPWSITANRSLAAQTRLCQAEQQLGSLVSFRLRPPSHLFDKDSPQLVLPPLAHMTRYIS